MPILKWAGNPALLTHMCCRNLTKGYWGFNNILLSWLVAFQAVSARLHSTLWCLHASLPVWLPGSEAAHLHSLPQTLATPIFTSWVLLFDVLGALASSAGPSLCLGLPSSTQRMPREARMLQLKELTQWMWKPQEHEPTHLIPPPLPVFPPLLSSDDAGQLVQHHVRHPGRRQLVDLALPLCNGVWGAACSAHTPVGDHPSAGSFAAPMHPSSAHVHHH